MTDYQSDPKLMVTGEIPTWSLTAPQTFTFTAMPEPVGYWVLYPQSPHNLKFSMYHKPTDEQIKNTEALLGWGWEDAK
jgi:hypothetical protein